MIGYKPYKGEPMDEFMIRTNASLKDLRTKLCPETWDQTYFRSVYEWAGHLARMEHYAAQRLSHVVLRHDNYHNITTRAQGGNQGHGRNIKVWRWESQIYKPLGAMWHHHAFQKDTWPTTVKRLCAWRVSGAWVLPRARASLDL